MMDAQDIFLLRKEAKQLAGAAKLNKLNLAVASAEILFDNDRSDEWSQKAFAYTLIDLSKYYLEEGNTIYAKNYYDKLLNIQFNDLDKVMRDQIQYLRLKFDVDYPAVMKADGLSKEGKHEEAMAMYDRIILELSPSYHEVYGWTLYRYLKARRESLSPFQVRTYLSTYIRLLSNPRPSLLHSTILNFALGYSREHSELNLYNFFKAWGPKNLRSEDKSPETFGGNTVPSLVSRLFRVLVETDAAIDVFFLLENVSMGNYSITGQKHKFGEQLLDLLREPFFWRIFNAHKENQREKLWKLFDTYNTLLSVHQGSKWHSEVLSLAERFMQEGEQWRFIHFFRSWNPAFLGEQDWKESINDGRTYKALVIKCLNNCFEIIKQQKQAFDQKWILSVYEKALVIFPNQQWLLREYALLLTYSGQLADAIMIFRKLVLELGDKFYVWQELANCITEDDKLRIGMLSKAITLEKDESFLGDIRLNLAQLLLRKKMKYEAAVELELYRLNREKKDWKLSNTYFQLQEELKDTPINRTTNTELYQLYSPLAEAFAYKDIPWTELALVDRRKTEEGKNRLTLSDGKSVEISISANKFRLLKQASLGEIFRFKMHCVRIIAKVAPANPWSSSDAKFDQKYIPLLVEDSDKQDWSIFEQIFAVVDYINIDKNIVHAISSTNKEIFFFRGEGQFEIGDFLVCRSFTRKVKDQVRLEVRDLRQIQKESALSQFPSHLAIVDGVNLEKQLFHYVIDNKRDGILKFSQTVLRPVEGEFLNLVAVSKFDKKENKIRLTVLEASKTDKVNPALKREMSGMLRLKYKIDRLNYDRDDLDEEEVAKRLPDYGFIDDNYVPGHLLRKYSIRENCMVKATIIFAGGKWKMIDIVNL